MRMCGRFFAQLRASWFSPVIRLGFCASWILINAAGCGTGPEEWDDKSSPTQRTARFGELVPSWVQNKFASVPSARVVLGNARLNVKPSHLGLSQEWWRGPLEHKDLKAMFQRFKSYETGPMMFRIGGATADELKYVPGPAVWAQFSRLHYEFGFQFIINLNLGTAKLELTKMQRDAALQHMPKGSIRHFEIGNEPNYFAKMGYKPDDYLNYYPKEFAKYATYIQCSQKPGCAGPAWGHIYQKPENLEWFIKTNRSQLDLLTAHFYKAASATYNTPETLLDEAAVKNAMASLSAQVKVANSYGLPLRIDESNPISGGGLDGVSNVFAAALWIIDSAFETVEKGAAGIDFHQGSHLYAFFLEQGLKSVDDKNGTIVPQPAYYGILFFLEALRGSGAAVTSLLNFQTSDILSPNVKIWPIKQGNQHRIVLLNKDPWVDADLTIELPSEHYSDGSLLQLTAPSLAHKKEILLGGQNFDSPGGFPSGKQNLIYVKKQFTKSKATYQVKVPKASAAILKIDAL